MADPLNAAIAGVQRIEAAAEKAGKEVADFIVGRFPPEPPEAVFHDAVDMMLQDLAECFKKENRSEVFSAEFVALMQLTAADSFSARLAALVEAGKGEGGRA